MPTRLALGQGAVMTGRTRTGNHARMAHRGGSERGRRAVTEVAGHRTGESRGHRNVVGGHPFCRCPVVAGIARAGSDAGVTECCRQPSSRLVTYVAGLGGKNMVYRFALGG